MNPARGKQGFRFFVPVAGGMLLNLLFLLPVGAAISTPTGSMSSPRASHTATLLVDGRVLVAGGINGPVSGLAFASAEVLDPLLGKWTATNSMSVGRYGHTATLLQNGKVLVVGGATNNGGYLASAELYDPVAGTWTPAGSMNFSRQNHAATLLTNGWVLVTGGIGSSGYPTLAELYNPNTGTWTTNGAGTLSLGRYFHTATLLGSGKVMIAGGWRSGVLSSVEIFDPTTGLWTTNGVGTMTTARQEHTATLLPNGNVLVAAGASTFNSLTSAEVFNPTTRTWTTTGSLTATNGRVSHAATLLPNGQVLVSGGAEFTPGANTLSTMEIYDPGSGVWATTSTMNTQRVTHTMTLLANGRLLLAGGQAQAGDVVLASAEIFDYTSSTWSVPGSLKAARYEHTATLLTNGQVLIAAGRTTTNFLSSAELYDPVNRSNTFTGSLNTPRALHRATLLNNGQVLITGGTNSGAILSSAEIYDPLAASNSLIAPMNLARDHHTASLLLNGQVLVVGGIGTGGAISNAEIFDPVAGTWTNTTSMHTPRYDHTATLLPDGRVIVIGGYNASPLASGEIYDPVAATWTQYNSIAGTSRSLHTATLMPDGKVIVAGGMQSASTFAQSITLVDPIAGTSSGVAALQTPRYLHTAVLLLNGKVLFAGGFGGTSIFGGSVQNSAELYDRATSICRTTASMPLSVEYHSMVLLTNGQALVSGGAGSSAVSIQSLYDTGLNFSNSWQPQIPIFTPSLPYNQTLSAQGTQLRGIGEGSSGGSQTSPGDHPVVQLRRLEGGQTIILPVDTSGAIVWSPTSYTSARVTNFSPGLAMGTMFVNGIPSASKMVAVVKGFVDITISNLVQTFDGTAKSVSVSISPTGLPLVVTYNGSTSPPTNAGNYSVVATVNDLNYGGSKTNTLQIVPVFTRSFGVDVSHFQGASGIDPTNWALMFAQGKRFAFIKATEGLTGPDDATMAINVSRATQAGLLAGVYHFAHAENRPNTNGAVQEAGHFLGFAGSAIGPGFLRPVLDIEFTSTNLPPPTMTDWIIAFSNEIIKQRGVGAAPIIYCTTSFAVSQFDSRLAGYDAWIRSVNGLDPNTANPSTTGVFTNWSFWQYSVGSAGGISPIDLDVCHDELHPLASFLIPAASGSFNLKGVTSDTSGIHLNFTNVPGTHFTVLSATNILLPLSNWTVVGSVPEVSPGQFQFADPGATNQPRLFYRVRSP